MREMSLALSEKDFTTKIVPQGSNEMRDLMNNMNNMVKEINDFFIVVKRLRQRQFHLVTQSTILLPARRRRQMKLTLILKILRMNLKKSTSP